MAGPIAGGPAGLPHGVAAGMAAAGGTFTPPQGVALAGFVGAPATDAGGAMIGRAPGPGSTNVSVPSPPHCGAPSVLERGSRSSNEGNPPGAAGALRSSLTGLLDTVPKSANYRKTDSNIVSQSQDRQ
jgi:hypothetical protein